MKTVEGDLIKLAQAGQFDVIVHGCNCFCVMGKGLAKGIKWAFPAAFEADQTTEQGSREKLGTCSIATCKTRGGGLYCSQRIHSVPLARTGCEG